MSVRLGDALLSFLVQPPLAKSSWLLPGRVMKSSPSVAFAAVPLMAFWSLLRCLWYMYIAAARARMIRTVIEYVITKLKINY